jgi:hypothetical protein
MLYDVVRDTLLQVCAPSEVVSCFLLPTPFNAVSVSNEALVMLFIRSQCKRVLNNVYCSSHLPPNRQPKSRLLIEYLLLFINFYIQSRQSGYTIHSSIIMLSLSRRLLCYPLSNTLSAGIPARAASHMATATKKKAPTARRRVPVEDEGLTLDHVRHEHTATPEHRKRV